MQLKFSYALCKVIKVQTSLLLHVDDRAEAGDLERPVKEVRADAVHGRVDNLDTAPCIHGLVVDKRAEVVVVLLGDGLCTYDIRSVPFPLSAISRNLPN